MSIKKKYIIIYLFWIFLLLTFSACSSKIHQSQNLPTKQLITSNCRAIKHDLGEACIPNHPHKIIVSDEIMLDAILALGIKPIAVGEPDFVSSKTNILGTSLKELSSIGKQSQPNLERIVKLNPDLIIGFLISQENYKLLSQIAPTVALKYNQSTWKDALRRIGEIVGEQQKAEILLSQYQQRLAKLRTYLGNKLTKINVSVSRLHGQVQSPEFRSKFSFPGSILDEIGIAPPESQRKLITTPDQNFIQLSLEKLDLLDASFLFIAVDPGAKDLFKKYQKTQMWQALNVVKNQRVYIVDSSYWIFGNIQSANAILNDLFKYLLNKA